MTRTDRAVHRLMHGASRRTRPMYASNGVEHTPGDRLVLVLRQRAAATHDFAHAKHGEQLCPERAVHRQLRRNTSGEARVRKRAGARRQPRAAFRAWSNAQRAPAPRPRPPPLAPPIAAARSAVPRPAWRPPPRTARARSATECCSAGPGKQQLGLCARQAAPRRLACASAPRAWPRAPAAAPWCAPGKLGVQELLAQLLRRHRVLHHVLCARASEQRTRARRVRPAPHARPSRRAPAAAHPRSSP